MSVVAWSTWAGYKRWAFLTYILHDLYCLLPPEKHFVTMSSNSDNIARNDKVCLLLLTNVLHAYFVLERSFIDLHATRWRHSMTSSRTIIYMHGHYPHIPSSRGRWRLSRPLSTRPQLHPLMIIHDYGCFISRVRFMRPFGWVVFVQNVSLSKLMIYFARNASSCTVCKCVQLRQLRLRQLLQRGRMRSWTWSFRNLFTSCPCVTVIHLQWFKTWYPRMLMYILDFCILYLSWLFPWVLGTC